MGKIAESSSKEEEELNANTRIQEKLEELPPPAVKFGASRKVLSPP